MAEPKTGRRKCWPIWQLDHRLTRLASSRYSLLRMASELEPEISNGLLGLLKLRMSEDAASYHAQLKQWGSKYHVTDSWFQRCVQRTLEFYEETFKQHPDALPAIFYAFDRRDRLPTVQTPPLPDLTWNPIGARREKMERCYREYLDAVEKAYLEAGYEPSPPLRLPPHFAWLAGYQFCGWSKNAIAEASNTTSHPVTRTAVIKAIKSLAGEIELTLRDPAANNRAWTAKKIRGKLVALLEQPIAQL
jgi:hypothetical protein